MVLAQGDFDLALRGLLGEEAALSANTVGRLKHKWQAEWKAWQNRPVEDLEVVYLWADGIYVKAGLEKEKAVLLVGKRSSEVRLVVSGAGAAGAACSQDGCSSSESPTSLSAILGERFIPAGALGTIRSRLGCRNTPIPTAARAA